MLKPGDVIYKTFFVGDSSGALANADETPTATLVRNGVDTAEMVVVTNPSTGRYLATVTIPVGWAVGDTIELLVFVTVSDVANATSLLIDVLNSNNAVADAILDRTNGVETGLTLRQALRLVCSVLFGKASGAPAGPLSFRNYGDTKNRVTMTTDVYGNRSTVTRDGE